MGKDAGLTDFRTKLAPHLEMEERENTQHPRFGDKDTKNHCYFFVIHCKIKPNDFPFLKCEMCI